MGDMRVDTGLLENMKVRRLIHQAGQEAILFLIRFWSWVALNRSDGTLSGIESCDDFDIVVGTPGGFGKTLLELKFIDIENGIWVVHDWFENQPWVALQEQRSEAARLSYVAKFDRKLYKHLVGLGMSGLSKVDYETIKNAAPSSRLATAQRLLSERSTIAQQSQANGSAPSPSPTPNPSPGTNSESEKLRPRSPAISALHAFKSKISIERVREFHEQFIKSPPSGYLKEERVNQIRQLPETHFGFLREVVERWNKIAHVCHFGYRYDSELFQAIFTEARICYGDKAILEMIGKVRNSEFLSAANTRLTLKLALGKEFDAITGGSRDKIHDFQGRSRDEQHFMRVYRIGEFKRKNREPVEQ